MPVALHEVRVWLIDRRKIAHVFFHQPSSGWYSTLCGSWSPCFHLYKGKRLPRRRCRECVAELANVSIREDCR